MHKEKKKEGGGVKRSMRIRKSWVREGGGWDQKTMMVCERAT